MTKDFNFMESVIWAFNELNSKGLIYRGFKIMPYSIECGTPLSNSEASDNYKDVVDTAVYVKFAVKNELGTYFVAWTTTPWTLPSNLALAMNPTLEYVKIKDLKTDTYYILSKNCLDNIYGKLALSPKYDIITTYKGIDFKDIEYVPVFDYFVERTFKVLMADFVQEGSGTGIVHISPSFGQDDFDIAIESGIVTVENIGNYCPVDENGSIY